MADVDALLAGAVNPKVQLGKLAELLERSGVDLDMVARVKTVKAYQMGYKDNEGEPGALDLLSIDFVPTFADGPQWPVITPGPNVKLPAAPRQARPVVGFQTCVVLPDIQIGYFRTKSEELEPIHDEAALSVALQIVKAEKPDQVVLVGDNLDLCEFGKYRTSPPFQRTTQAAIDRATVLCAQLRAAAPDARIVWLAGNHEERLPNFILDNAATAFGLRKGDTPDSWPVMSVPYLCRFDDYAIEYLPGYPASCHWINERLRIIHGDKVASGGSTAHKYLATEKVSTIYGHIHRREWAERTRRDYDGPKTIMAASPGCLARTDGAVPSTKGGIDLDGRPVAVQEDWQSGLAVVRYEPGDGRFAYEQIAIHDGWALHRGREYNGKDK